MSPLQNPLPNERRSITHRFVIRSTLYGATKFYLTVGLYDDGRPGEVFVRMSKEGELISHILDQWAISVSMMLQVGVPVETIIDKFRGTNFEPCGWTENKTIHSCTSPIDYIAKWLELKFVT